MNDSLTRIARANGALTLCAVVLVLAYLILRPHVHE